MDTREIELRIKTIIETNDRNKNLNAQAEGELKSLNEQQAQILNELGVNSGEELISKEETLKKELESMILEAESIQNPPQETQQFENFMNVG